MAKKTIERNLLSVRKRFVLFFCPVCLTFIRVNLEVVS